MFCKIIFLSVLLQVLTFPLVKNNSLPSHANNLGTVEQRNNRSTNYGLISLAQSEPKGGGSEPEPEDGGPEPEDGGPEPEGSEAEDWPEPGPRWEDAYGEWGPAWELHIYGFAISFFLVFVYALYYVIINIADGLRRKYLSVSLNVMMAVSGFTRALVLTLDPYHQGSGVDTPLILMRILWSLTDPCLTAGDSLCILSLVETYKLSIAPHRLQSPKTILPVVGIHFGFVFISDLVVSNFVEAKAMLLFCQIFFITWCAILGLAYFVLAYKLDVLIFKSHVTVDAEISQEGRWYIYLIYASGVANLVTSLVYIYSAAGVFGVYSDVTYVEAWPWWSLQTSLRVTELIAVVLVFTVSAKRVQPTQPREGGDEPAIAAASRKRKQSMFSALRGKRDVLYAVDNGSGSVASGEMIEYDSEQNCDGLINEHVHDIGRKDSMFTALADKAKLAAQT